MDESNRDAARRVETFPYYETVERLAGLASRWGDELRVDASSRAFEAAADGAAVRLTPPLVLPPPREGETAGEYLARVPEKTGIQLLVLLQAGTAALGLWRDGELVQHKAFQRYVVRGKGVAQTTHLKTKGKSRFGSRLRLRNARRLLEEVNERLRQWWEQYGPGEVFHSCPVRLWPELFGVRPPPPFEQRDARLRRVPIHVHTPRFEELLRVRRFLERGTIESETMDS